MKKPLKVAAWSGIGILLIGVIASIVQEILISSGVSTGVLNIVDSPFNMISLIFGILFMYGFVVLADKFDGTLLRVMAWIGIVMYSIFLLFVVVGFVFSLIGMSLPALSPEALNFSSGDEISGVDLENGEVDIEEFKAAILEGEEFDIEEFKTIILGIIVFLIVLWLAISIPISIYMVLFGVGMLKLKNDVPLANVVGVLNIIAGATFVIFIGVFLALVAFILEIIMFFMASGKFEKKGRKKKR
tara:strand:- start:1467 stop:2198 length:732 start_codon:yes stop_codon:yes gene_type:complete